MPEKFYIIGKFEDKERVRILSAKLEGLGYENSYDWTTHKPIKPYSENPELATEYSENELKAISESDIIICLTSKDGTTSKLEMGGAMLLKFTQGKPLLIYAVGESNSASPWYMNKIVKRVGSEDEVISDLALRKSNSH